MDPNQPPTNRQTDHLGVNKMGKNIKKSPLHHPNFASAARQQPQPHVYNINKNDFRDIVQQLTGSPLRDPHPRPPQNHPKLPNNRLQRVRPPPLAQTLRPRLPINPHSQMRMPPQNLGRPPPLPAPFDHQPSPTPPDMWANPTESPISAYMRYLQNSIIESGPRQPSPFPQPQNPPLNLPSPRFNGPPPPLLPSPTSQFLLPSPTGFLNLLSPRSPYPLLSPPLSPNFSFSSMGQSGILGPGPHPPPSPGYGFPLSPSGFFPSPGPRWRNQ